LAHCGCFRGQFKESRPLFTSKTTDEHPFWIAEREVTAAEWLAFVNDAGSLDAVLGADAEARRIAREAACS